MNDMSQWAPLIYGRTYEVDYRFLAIPEDFDHITQNWCLSYIQGLLQKPDALKQASRWGLFSNDKHCIFGVACLVKQLTHSFNQKYDLTKDKANRPLYLFVGYVTQIDSDKRIDDIPSYFSLFKQNLSIFQNVIHIIEQQWLIKPYKYRSDSHTRTYKYEKCPDFIRPFPLNFNYRLDYKKLKPNNRNYGQVKIEYLFSEDDMKIWPDSQTNREDLWENACKYIARHYPLSLCFGLSSEKEILDSPFMNATALDLPKLTPKNPRKHIKKSAKSSQVTVSSPSEKKNTSSFFQKYRSLLVPSVLGLIGVLIISRKALLIGLLFASIGYFFLIVEKNFRKNHTP